MSLPTTDLRQNVLTLAIPSDRLPAVAYTMRTLLPAEEYDPSFDGQFLQTTYFDTWSGDLRKARLDKERYCTIRIRAYAPTTRPGAPPSAGPDSAYAISAKTEEEKYREELEPALAEQIIRRGFALSGGGNAPESPFPAHITARLLELTDGEPIIPAVTVCFTRYAVENHTDRITLDCDIRTSTGKVFPTNVLENKTTGKPPRPIPELVDMGYNPVKLSKFLWATTYGVR
jgi:hypothetical protein